ncbi:MAG: GNAT family N-acetyltransferase [Salinivirgaceae bacterium]|jgi:GNAT superfamily N-acetyltransferase|nr:GNAT family N-acetyltransferase [Salinivirgaceae bacterium]
MQFEIITPNDLTKIKSLQPEGWSDILIDFKLYTESDFCIPLKVEIDNDIAGVGSAILFQNTCWIAHIIVAHNHRRKGIGNAIVDQLIKHAKSKGIFTCLLSATEMGASVYERLGFKNISPYAYLKKDKEFQEFKQSANIKPFSINHIKPLLALDLKATAENREALLKLRLNNALVYLDKNQVKGYFLPNLGEGVIIAEDKITGEELMKVKYNTTDKAVLPLENKAGIKYLTQNGFVEIPSRGTRMVYGINVEWQPKMIFSRLGPNFG